MGMTHGQKLNRWERQKAEHETKVAKRSPGKRQQTRRHELSEVQTEQLYNRVGGCGQMGQISVPNTFHLSLNSKTFLSFVLKYLINNLNSNVTHSNYSCIANQLVISCHSQGDRIDSTLVALREEFCSQNLVVFQIVTPQHPRMPCPFAKFL